MIAAVLKETIIGETRVAATPKTVLELIDSGFTVHVESGAGNQSFFSDQDYVEAGAQIKEDAKSTLSDTNLILKVVSPTLNEIELFPNDSIFISFFNLFTFSPKEQSGSSNFPFKIESSKTSSLAISK